MREIMFPRCVKPKGAIGNPILITFSDASEHAFGACCYLRWETAHNEFQSQLFTSKSRVAPVKKMSIVRLELSAAVLATRIRTFVEQKTRFIFDQYIHIVDSEIIRAMIQKESYDFNTFVGTRVGEIQSHTEPTQWYWIKGDQNIADVITRGTEPSKIGLLSEWQNGPPFMTTKECQIADLPERNTIVLTVNVEVDNCPINIERFSDYLKLLRVTAYALRFINNLKNKVIYKKPLVLQRYLSANEVNDARRLWLIDNQASIIKDGTFCDLVRNLNLVKDDMGLLRSFSRLKNANIPYDTKAPILVNTNHKLAELIVYYCPLRVLHRATKQTLTEVRSMFWITRGRRFISKLLHRCTKCKRLNARPYEYPNFSNMPEIRFGDKYPFYSTGVDLLGPLLCLPVYGDSEKLYKAFIVIFTCTATRAVVLEVVHNGNADTFIYCCKRFISRRRRC